MANEEQRRAFASYMGTTGAGAGQQTPQYPGAYPNSGNPYLFQQFPGVQGLPAAPTPPPAASSSVASYPSYQGGFQGGYQAGLSGGYGQNNFPQRPPPLGGQSEASPHQQAAPLSANTPGYNAGWQYTDPRMRQNGQPSAEAARGIVMAPPSRNFSGDIVESQSKHIHEQYRYQQYEQPNPPNAGEYGQNINHMNVPVLLCHTCSICSRMRSAGYHRNNPVVPGKPLVLTPCRRCKKKSKNEQRSTSRYTRIRSCTAEEPCQWPRECIHIDLEHHEQRGRQRSRERIYVYSQSPSRPRVIRESRSQTGLGLRVLQQEQSPIRVMRSTVRVQTSSLSPPRGRKDDEIWPPPDIVRMKSSKPEATQPPRPANPNITSRDEVWPPPDVVRTHSHRRVTASPPRTYSSRIVEPSSSPPPTRTRVTRVEYRSDSLERRARSISPVRFVYRDEQRSKEAEARMMSHPRPYRPLSPERREFLRGRVDTSSEFDTVPRGRQESPNRGILKSSAGEHETSHRRMSMRESQQSIAVGIGGPRVHFSSERRSSQPPPDSRDKPRYIEEDRRPSEEQRVHHEYSRHRYVDERPRSPPIEEMERLRIRRPPIASHHSYEEEVRIDRARRLSPSPPRRPEETRRYESPPRERERERRLSPLAADRLATSGYRHVPRTRVLSRTHSVSPPPPMRRAASEDMTDSESAHSENIIEVRRWRGIDKDGKPATFVEERSTKLLEQGSEKGGLAAEVRPMNDNRVTSRNWRDV